AGVTALYSLLALSPDARGFQSALYRHESFSVAETETRVIKGATGGHARRLQRQHQRRIVQLELGVIGPPLGRSHAEQHGVERYRPVQVRDIQGKVESDGRRHRQCLAHENDPRGFSPRPETTHSKYTSVFPCSA